MLKDMDFYHSQESGKKQILGKGLDASKNVVHKASESTGNKTVDTITKSNNDNTEKQESVEEIITPSAKRQEILNKLRRAL